MTFTPPVFSILRVNTLNLEARLSTLLDRYKIVDNTTSTTDALTQNSLEVLIARTNQVIACKSDRQTALDVFSKLVSELREVLKENDKEKNKQAAMFLLGALIHRYFRLIKEYDNYSYSYWGPSSVMDCTLFKAIRAALQFDIRLKTDFISKDLKILDVTTIVNALEVFRDNMLLEDKHKVPRYKNYPHFAKDTNFTKYLKEIIDTYTAIGLPILNRFKAIRFIQSLANQMEFEHQQIEEELQKWSKLLIAEHPEFTKLTSEILEAHIIRHIKSDLIRAKILELVYTPRIQDNLRTMNHQTFIVEMNTCHLNIASYTVFGSYALILQSQGIDDKLKFCLHQALGIEKKAHELTEKDMLDGISFLKIYVEDYPETVLDCTFFGGRDKLNTQISQKELSLVSSINAQAEKDKTTQKDKTTESTITM